MESVYFSYDGVYSQDMGVYLVQLKNGMASTPFLAKREIVSESVFGKDIPFVYGVQRQPLELELTFGSLSSNFWSFEKRREIARWLDVKRFAEFYVTDVGFIDRRFFLMYEGGVDLVHTGAREGYLTVNFRNVSPFTYSPVISKVYDFATNPGTTVIEVENLGNEPTYPYIQLKKLGAGAISIRNVSDEGRTSTFVNLLDGEVIDWWNEDRIIQSSVPNLYRYADFNQVYVRLSYGVNRLEVTGTCEMKWWYRYIFTG